MSTVEESVTRVYTINLGRAWLTPEHKRTDRVINMIREFAEKHMKSGEVKLDQDLNRQIWSRGKTNPPRKVRVKMVKDEDDTVTVSLYEESNNESTQPPAQAKTIEAVPADKTSPEETKSEAEQKTK